MECTYPHCTNTSIARNYCHKHYKRYQRHGDPNIVKEGHKFREGYDPRRPIVFVSPGGYKKHNMCGTLAYSSWKSMKARCLNPRATAYPRYGAKGIRVCDRWLIFENFYEDMGVRLEGTSLDRIDSKGNYEPSNCRWASFKEQARNSGRSKVSA